MTKHRREKLAELVIDLKPLPGIEDWILTAHALGLKLAVASSSPRYWVVGHLERTNLLNYFDLIITKEDVKASKPNPEAYQMVLDDFQIKADEALAIEDSPVGASAAVSAGLRCIIVPNKLTKGLSFPLTFRTVSNLVELSLHKTIEELTPNPFLLVKHRF